MFQTSRQAFSLVEVLVCIAILALLLALLLPMLSQARFASYGAMCSNNLRQINTGWTGYLLDNEKFPQAPTAPEWNYGGVTQTSIAKQNPALDPLRPINKYLADDIDRKAHELALLFRCPADRGVFTRGQELRSSKLSILEDGKNCFATFGTSYRANPRLLNSTAAGIDGSFRPLRLAEVQVATSRMLMLADTAWHYATRPATDPDSRLEAGWHGQTDAGYMLAVDGSIRFINFSNRSSGKFTLSPRSELPD